MCVRAPFRLFFPSQVGAALDGQPIRTEPPPFAAKTPSVQSRSAHVCPSPGRVRIVCVCEFVSLLSKTPWSPGVCVRTGHTDATPVKRRDEPQTKSRLRAGCRFYQCMLPYAGC